MASLITVLDPTADVPAELQRYLCLFRGLSSRLHVFTRCMWDWFILKDLRRSSQNHLFIHVKLTSNKDRKLGKWFWWCRYPGFKCLSLRNTLTGFILIRSQEKYKNMFISVYFARFIFKHHVGMKNNTMRCCGSDPHIAEFLGSTEATNQRPSWITDCSSLLLSLPDRTSGVGAERGGVWALWP